uniref:Uncharacterized protein n=1 Tax=Tanacetum cinerariifolium TaxID=118510 RepID=A0A699JF04_TANCI|nr:hypothetical protein [Tanacetum cinerariifolium]
MPGFNSIVRAFASLGHDLAVATLTEFELKKILIDKMNSSESYLTAPEHRECYDGLIKSYNLDKDFFSSYDVYSLKRSRHDKDKDEGPSTRSDQGLKKRKTSKDAAPTTSLKNKDSSSRSSKGTKSQPKSSGKSVHVEEPEFEALSEKLDWDNPEGGDYPFDLSKSLPLIMHGNRQSVPVEFFINNDLKYLQGEILTMIYTTSTTKAKVAQAQRKSYYAYARGKQSRGDVYSTKRILAVTHVSVMRKHGYGYLEEIMNWLTNLLGDDVADFQINVTKPDTTRPDLIKRHPYNPYKDPQGIIYVDDYQRNRLMRSDKLYKFSDGTLTRLLSSLEDITTNIDMEYLSKRRWSKLEKKRAYFIIKDINNLLQEKRMRRSLEKFVGGRLYKTDLRLLQRTI